MKLFIILGMVSLGLTLSHSGFANENKKNSADPPTEAKTAEILIPDPLPDFRVGLSLLFVNTGFELTPLPSADNDNLSLTYRPPQSTYLGVMLGYKWAGGTAHFAIPASEEVRNEEGEGDYANYGVSVYFKKWGFQTFYDRFKRYIIDNESSEDPPSAATLNGETYYALPALKSLGLGLNLFFSENDDFHLAAAFDGSEIQKKSAGSWIGIFSARFQNFVNDGAILPDEKKPNFGSDSEIKSAEMWNASAGMGYSYIWVRNAFFLSPFLGLSLGAETTKWELTNNQSFRNNDLSLNGHAKINIGYNIRRFLVSLLVSLDRFQQDTRSMEFATNVLSLQIRTAFRF